MPSDEAQKMYYSFLNEITQKNPSLQIIINSGNHDSAARLEAVNPLLENMNITVKGIIKRDAEGNIDIYTMIIPIKDGGVCLAVTYIRQGDYPINETYSTGIKEIYSQLKEKVKDTEGPVIAMGHLQATGSEISENDRSERTIIGGMEGVKPDTFEHIISYTALWHLPV